VKFTVDPLAAQRFALACGDDNPLYFDLAAARAAGLPGLIAPPLFITSQNSWEAGPATVELAFDGVNPQRFPGAISAERTTLGGSQELELRRPVRMGETLEVSVELKDSFEKESSQGTLRIFVIEARFADAGGELVAIARDSVITAPAKFGTLAP
jgi:acyl dehydratase